MSFLNKSKDGLLVVTLIAGTLSIFVGIIFFLHHAFLWLRHGYWYSQTLNSGLCFFGSNWSCFGPDSRNFIWTTFEAPLFVVLLILGIILIKGGNLIFKK